ncbi:hypothetical protein D3C78_1327120 [compost metagenome]
MKFWGSTHGDPGGKGGVVREANLSAAGCWPWGGVLLRAGGHVPAAGAELGLGAAGLQRFRLAARGLPGVPSFEDAVPGGAAQSVDRFGVRRLLGGGHAVQSAADRYRAGDDGHEQHCRGWSALLREGDAGAGRWDSAVGAGLSLRLQSGRDAAAGLCLSADAAVVPADGRLGELPAGDETA